MIDKFLEKFEDLDLTRLFAGVRLPDFAIDQKYYKELNLPTDASNLEVLKSLAQRGYTQLVRSGKIDKSKAAQYRARAKQELDTFDKLHVVNYVLIVWDVVNFCKEKGIANSPGRGSVAGSLIFYLIGVTLIDPLEYGLFFERFLSEARAKSQVIDGILYIDGSLMPDVDLDCSYLRRHEVVEYLNQKYPDRTAKIINLSTLTGKNLIKECGKVVGGKNEFEMTQIADMIPQIYGEVQDIEEIYEKDQKFKEWCDQNPSVYDVALKLRDLIKNKSVHASGIAISYDPINEICPLTLSKDAELAVDFDMKDVAQFCVKLDILGLKTATIVDEVCKSVDIKMEDINFNDPQIYAFFQEFENTFGIFQLEGLTATKVTRWVKPTNIEELAAVNALARPAALHSVQEFVDNKKDGAFKVIHPIFEKILEETHGLPLFQEQLLKMLHALGFTLLEAEEVRRIVGKKDRQAVKAWEEKIYAKTKEQNYPEEVGKWLWDVLYKSKDYSFNKSHAISYSVLSAICVYLKIHHPKEFFLASLNIITKANDPKKAEKIAQICRELKYYQIPLLPPDIRYSKTDFSLEKEGIRYGLSSVKGVSSAALEHLRKFSPDYGNKFQMFESIKQAGITLGPACALTMAGALSDFGTSRTKLVLEMQLWGLLKPSEKAYCLEHGHEYNFNLLAMIKIITEWVGANGKKVARATRYNTIKRGFDQKGYKKIYELNNKFPDFANFFYEYNLLNYNYSNSLQEIFGKTVLNLKKIEEFDPMEQKDLGTFVGIVTQATDGTSRNKKKYTKMTFEDGTGSLTGFAFEETRARLMGEKRIPKVGEIAVFRGYKWQNILRLEHISVQSHRIFMKLAELKNHEENNESRSK